MFFSQASLIVPCRVSVSLPVLKVKCATPHEDCRRGAHLPSLGRQPAGVKPLKSVTHGQCDARPTVTFPAAGHHRTLTGNKIILLGDRGIYV